MSSELIFLDRPIIVPTILNFSSVDNIEFQLNIILRDLLTGGTSKSHILTSYIIDFNNWSDTLNVTKPFSL